MNWIPVPHAVCRLFVMPVAPLEKIGLKPFLALMVHLIEWALSRGFPRTWARQVDVIPTSHRFNIRILPFFLKYVNTLTTTFAKLRVRQTRDCFEGIGEVVRLTEK
jgi:hypothetical protein